MQFVLAARIDGLPPVTESVYSLGGESKMALTHFQGGQLISNTFLHRGQSCVLPKKGALLFFCVFIRKAHPLPHCR